MINLGLSIASLVSGVVTIKIKKILKQSISVMARFEKSIHQSHKKKRNNNRVNGSTSNHAGSIKWRFINNSHIECFSTDVRQQFRKSSRDIPRNFPNFVSRYRGSFIGNSEGAWNLCQLVAIDHRSEIAIPREQTEPRTAKTVSPVSRTLHLLVFFYPRRLNAPELCVCCARETRSINGGNWRQKRKKIETRKMSATGNRLAKQSRKRRNPDELWESKSVLQSLPWRVKRDE